MGLETIIVFSVLAIFGIGVIMLAIANRNCRSPRDEHYEQMDTPPTPPGGGDLNIRQMPTSSRSGSVSSSSSDVRQRSTSSRSGSVNSSSFDVRQRPSSSPLAPRRCSDVRKKRSASPASSVSSLSSEHCGICMERRPKVTIHPCGHDYACKSCVIQIMNNENRLCPYCRRDMQNFTDK